MSSISGIGRRSGGLILSSLQICGSAHVKGGGKRVSDCWLCHFTLVWIFDYSMIAYLSPLSDHQLSYLYESMTSSFFLCYFKDAHVDN